jgi:hypothetical protein
VALDYRLRIRAPSEIVGYGDSYVDATTIEDPTALELLGTALGVSYDNNGVGGSTGSDMATVVSNTIGDIDSRAAVYLWNNGNEFDSCLDGACDYESISAASASAIAGAVSSILAVTPDVTVIGPLDSGITPDCPTEVRAFMTTVGEAYDAALRSALSGHAIVYVDFLNLSRELNTKIGPSIWDEDGFHFSGVGHAAVYQRLIGLRR